MQRIAHLLGSQAGVVARHQVLTKDSGVLERDLRRWLSRRELVRVHPGVYVDHTGELTWVQRAWAAVLAVAPAALGAESAMRAADGPGRPGSDEGPIRVVVERGRKVVAPEGVIVTRTFDLEDRVLWNLGPPRMRYDEAALDVALTATGEFGAIGVIARAVQNRHATAARMRAVLDERSRAPRRAWVAALLDDVAQGTCSVLEHGYLTRVEQPHGLPPAERQEKGACTLGVAYRDARHGDFYVELDGRLFHDTAAQRDRDFDRDLDAVVAGRRTVRLSWGQVFDRPCATAARLNSLFVAAGLPPGHPCGASCATAEAA